MFSRLVFSRLMFSRLKTIPLVFAFLFCTFTLFAQAPKRYTASEIQLALEKLNVLGSVLYIAAHPDDENTQLITWLSKEKRVETGYLSLTRGDGGQNLIGPEIRESLGVIRTQELLQARKIDGGQQFFSRANDFGYSKNPDETFTIWDREKVLSDMVWVIRKFRPDIIITRFSTVPGQTHGHHTASAILAEEAFKAAGDKTKFPEQLKYVSVWQPQRLLWNTSWWFYGTKDFDKTGLLPLEVGGYNPLLGKSYPEIAAASRSMHKSQGFGAALSRGSTMEYLKPILGGGSLDSLFAGINLTWSRVPGGKAIGKAISQILEKFEPENPATITKDLVSVYQKIQDLPDSKWKEIKAKEVKTMIKACMGLYLEAAAASASSAPGETVEFTFEATNRSKVPVELVSLNSEAANFTSAVHETLAFNQPFFFTRQIALGGDLEYAQPYWLRKPNTIGMYTVTDQKLIGKPENAPSVAFEAVIEVWGETFSFDVPLVYKYTDPAKGEEYQPFEVTPPVFINWEETVYVFPNEAPKKVKVLVGSYTETVKGNLKLTAPEGWQVSPQSVPVNFTQKGEEQSFTFEVTPPSDAAEATVQAILSTSGKDYSKSSVSIAYEHIPKQTLFPEATAKMVKLDVQKKGEWIGYLVGAGDDIPASLEQLGYKVDLLNNELITREKLKKYDAVVIGVRAYNTVERLKFYQPVLMEYVKAGGTLIVQYNTSFRLVTEDLGPYPLYLSRDRVTVENAPVQLLEPDHPLLNFPNKITEKDFEGWVQERGLYFPNEWSEEYTALLSSHDPGESPKKGGLLVTKYGKGHYIYTGYSWFRELPAGVPGAYRIFTNMISIGKNKLEQ